MLYSIAYHPHMDGSSKRTNQTIEIALRFFIYGLDNPSMWPTALSTIQLIINNTSLSTISKTPNEIAYDFTPCCLLDLLSALPSSAIIPTRIETVDAKSFMMANQKAHYDQKY